MSKNLEEIAHNYFNDPKFYSDINKEISRELDEFKFNLLNMAFDILREVKLYGQCTLIKAEPIELVDPRNVILKLPTL